ncbi:MAG: hypothetical protein L0H84_18365, partial [Pseudonocardia sp.]|nr:hypothetical protein [Pseudonocardia sp.]
DGQRSAAAARSAEARRQESAARSEAADASARLAAARKLADQARAVRDSGAKVASAALHNAADTAIERRGLFDRIVNAVDRTLREITASPEFASWMQVFSDVGNLCNSIGTVLAFIPGAQGWAAGFMIAGAALTGLSFLGTALAHRYGNASGSQLAGRGLDFAFSFAGAATAVRTAKAITAGREIHATTRYVRSLGYASSARSAGQAARWSSDVIVRGGIRIGLRPNQAFRVKVGVDTMGMGSKLTDTMDSLISDGARLHNDISHFGAPQPYGDLNRSGRNAVDEAIDIAGDSLDQEGVAGIVRIGADQAFDRTHR